MDRIESTSVLNTSTRCRVLAGTKQNKQPRDWLQGTMYDAITHLD